MFEMLLKAMWETRGAPQRDPSYLSPLSALPWGCVQLRAEDHKPGLLNSLEALLQRRCLAFLPRRMVPEGGNGGRGAGGRGCVSHCRWVTALGKETPFPQLSLKRFLGKVNNFSGGQ